ncbi:MAG: Hpt domain-containing protein, partial [Phycisphaerales bacterium]|nr:Hpt domain-containing protein [Phycisphaerales bacterium]
MFDQEIIQDFLTESGELLDKLDQDLVTLESTPTDPELLNGVFRALHTIKGSASFLSLTNLVSVAHAAESALNSARAGSIVLNKGAMDLILGAVDVLKRQFENLKAGQDLVKADDALVQGLLAVAEGRMPTGAHAPAEATPEPITIEAHAPEPVAAAVGAFEAPSPAAAYGPKPLDVKSDRQ